MEILPVHLVKLRWLLKKVTKLSRNDSEYIRSITKILSEVNYKEACPITLFMIESFYSKYKSDLKEAV